jgi:hypothetical protein
MDGGRSQHPDAEFAPERKLVIPPGGTYRPRQGSIWMLAVCGLDGVEGWRCAVDGVDAVVTDIIGKEQRR